MGRLKDVELHLIETVDEASQFMTWLGERRTVLAIDTETTGLDHRTDRIRLVQFGDVKDGWAMRWDRWSGVALEAIARYSEPIAMHNAKFDVLFLERAGEFRFPWVNLHDTRTLAHLDDPTKLTGLKPLAGRLVDPAAVRMQGKLDEAMAAAKWNWATVPMDFDPYWQYAALDTVLTAHVWEVLYPRMKGSASERIYDIEMACLRVLADMETRGAAVDLEYAANSRSQMLSYVADSRSWAQNTHGCSPGSNRQVANRFVELGAQMTKYTPKGQMSLDEEVLLELGISPLAGVSELATTVLKSRKYTKLVSTYLDHFLEKNLDGRVHGSINPLGAKTGRMAIQNPPLQTLPRADEGNPAAIAIRNCFIPSEGNKLLMADFDQIELRLMAHFSQDPTMLEVLSGQDDPFTEFARRIYNDPDLQKKDPRRQLTKNASYAKAYGAGPEKFSATAGVPIEQGRAFLEVFDQTFPGVRRFQGLVQHTAQERWSTEGEAYVRTPMGRRLKCEDDKFYKLVNYLIQGTAADVLKQKLVELDMAGLGEFLILPVHDEVIFDVPEDIVDEVARIAKHVMSENEAFAVPLPVGVEGPYARWGEKYGG